MRSIGGLLLLLVALPAAGQTLTFGQGTAPSSVDPHFYNGTANKSLASHIFDRLVEQSPGLALEPGLATRWTAVGDTVWEFKLRRGVRFSDGVPFTPDDVVFSVGRAPKVPNSAASFAGVVRAIVRTEVVDEETIRFHTSAPAPNLPNDLSNLAIVSRHAGEGAATEDYNSGKAAIGTGPYRLARYVTGERAELVRNDGWWGKRPEWEKVVFTFIPNPGTRAAALLAGDVDIIDTPLPSDLPRFRADARFQVFERGGTRMLFIAPDQSREGATPFVTDAAGQVLPVNPLRDRRVRKALSVAINRQALTSRIMQDTAAATGQWLPPGTYSYNPAVKVPEYAPEEARRLLAEAGYPQGFKVTLHVGVETRPTDATMAQAVGQMWTRVGVQTSIATMPWAMFTARGQKREFSLGIWSWGSNSGEAGYALINVFGSPDGTGGRGSYNRAGYANPALDALADRALSMLDDGAREALLREAVAMEAEDVGVIPLYQLSNFWVARKGITYEASAHERNMAGLAHLSPR